MLPIVSWPLFLWTCAGAHLGRGTWWRKMLTSWLGAKERTDQHLTVLLKSIYLMICLLAKPYLLEHSRGKIFLYLIVKLGNLSSNMGFLIGMWLSHRLWPELNPSFPLSNVWHVTSPFWGCRMMIMMSFGEMECHHGRWYTCLAHGEPLWFYSVSLLKSSQSLLIGPCHGSQWATCGRDILSDNTC